MNLSRYYDVPEEYSLVFEKKNGDVLAEIGERWVAEENITGPERYLKVRSAIQSCELDLV